LSTTVYVVLNEKKVIGVYTQFVFAQKMAEAGFSASAETENGTKTSRKHIIYPVKLDQLDFHLLHKGWFETFLEGE